VIKSRAAVSSRRPRRLLDSRSARKANPVAGESGGFRTQVLRDLLVPEFIRSKLLIFLKKFKPCAFGVSHKQFKER
jgi:hypothetical protein